ncbi:MAG: response regulator [Anaerolineae bacterium]|nr:response regulator [Anaerolineae bacterium]
MSPRILVIDDDNDTHLFLKLALQPYGHEVISAYSVSQGLNAARRRDPDLVVLEVAIENRAGFDLCRRLRLLPGGRARPIIIFSRLQQSGDIVRGLELGANEYVVKPVKQQEIVERIHALLHYDKASRPSTILVTSAKKGVGATTIAVNLGVALARYWREQVVLIDADIPGGDPAVHLGMHPTHTLADVIDYGYDVEPELVAGIAYEHKSGLRLISAPSEELEHPPEPDFLVPILNAMIGRHEYAIIDAPLLQEESLEVLMHLATHVLVVTIPEVPALRRTVDLLTLMPEYVAADETEAQITVVLNQANRAGGIPLENLPEELKAHRIAQIPFDPGRALRSINRGVPVVMRSPRSHLARSLRELARSLRMPGAEDEPRCSLSSRIRALLGQLSPPSDSSPA